jgi:hypothetical protein
VCERYGETLQQLGASRVPREGPPRTARRETVVYDYTKSWEATEIADWVSSIVRTRVHPS